MPLPTDKYILNDTKKKRRQFSTGMERDNREGKGRFDLISPFALLRLARIYEKGSKKYADRNWEKGCDFSVFIDSMFRHLAQYMMGDDDEDHLAQLAWNAFALMHLQYTHPELNNMPYYIKNKVDKEKIGFIIQVAKQGHAAREEMLTVAKKLGITIKKEKYDDPFLKAAAESVAKNTDKEMMKLIKKCEKGSR